MFEAVFLNDTDRLRMVLGGMNSIYESSKRLNTRDEHGRTAIFYAIFHSNFEMVNIMLQRGADTIYSDKLGRTVLHYAAMLKVSKNIV